MSLISVIDLFNWYASNMPKKITKNSPYDQRIEDEYLGQLDKVVWIGNNDDLTLLENFTKLIDEKSINENNVDWLMLYPQQNDFGFTAPNLTDKEQRHFAAIETIFKSDLNVSPQKWIIFDQKKVIGANSIFGTIIEVGPPGYPTMFVVKSPNNVSKDLLHEYFVGHIVCNYLRKTKLPNFPYYFGIIRCSKADVDASKKIKTWCESKDQIPQIVMENIKSVDDKGQIIPTITLRNFIQTANNDSINLVLNYFIGIMNAIFTAWFELRFSHNDLHTDNILLRKIANSQNKWMIPIFLNKGFIIAKSGDYVPTIIDFGKSSFEAKNSFVTLPQIMYEAEPNSHGKSRPMNDILHLMAFIKTNIIHQRAKLGTNFGQTVDIILEEIYAIFYSMISKTQLGTGALFDKIVVISTLEDFISQTANKTLHYNLPSTMMFIENNDFIDEFFSRVMKLEKLQPFLENFYLKPDQASIFQKINPDQTARLFTASQKLAGVKRKN